MSACEVGRVTDPLVEPLTRNGLGCHLADTEWRRTVPTRRYLLHERLSGSPNGQRGYGTWRVVDQRCRPGPFSTPVKPASREGLSESQARTCSAPIAPLGPDLK